MLEVSSSASERLRALATKEQWRSHDATVLAGLALDAEPLLPLIADVVESAEWLEAEGYDLRLDALRDALEESNA